MRAVVYWIHHVDHIDPYSEGYIGVTVNFDRRIKTHIKHVKKNDHLNEHLQNNLLNENVKITILHEDEEEVCYDLERKYRPDLYIGWNISRGGSDGGVTRTGYKLSDEFRENRRLHMIGNDIAKGNKGKPKTKEHREKISLSNKGKFVSEEQKIKQSLKMKGRKLSEEHKEKIRLNNLGKKRGPYKKKEKDNVAL
jgi:hypothetical protein